MGSIGKFRKPARGQPLGSIADLFPGSQYPGAVPEGAFAHIDADADSPGGSLAADAVLPELSSNEKVASLPEDPNDMLTVEERRQLVTDLIKLATLRRDAETASGSLRLA
jgi:hypothetical protein